MRKSHDRISILSDHILQSILCLLPLKTAVSTSILSKRWRLLWEYNLSSTTTLDFGEDFACTLSAKEFVATVNRYLELHGSNELERLRILFCPFDLFAADIERWITIAATKGVKELDLDLSQGIIDSQDGEYIDGRNPFKLPDCLFYCNSLTHLSLSRYDLCDSTDFSSFAGLLSLCLTHVNITDDLLQTLLTDCPLLESLSIRNCRHLVTVRVSGPDLQLRRLTIQDCGEAYELQISAPKLQSFHYFGQLCTENYFNDVSALVDACVCSIGVQNADAEHDHAQMLSDLANVKILTVCIDTLMEVTASEDFSPEAFPIQLQNLEELQLVMEPITDEHLTCIYAFFRLCPSPFLEKLFIQQLRDLEDQNDIRYAVTAGERLPDVTFDNLRVIKVDSFQGSRSELKLVKFLLEKAVVLESLVLVTSPKRDQNEGINKEKYDSLAQHKPRERASLNILRGQLSLLRKASPEARIVLCEYWEDDSGLNPTHTHDSADYSYLSATPCHRTTQALFRDGAVMMANM